MDESETSRSEPKRKKIYLILAVCYLFYGLIYLGSAFDSPVTWIEAGMSVVSFVLTVGFSRLFWKRHP